MGPIATALMLVDANQPIDTPPVAETEFLPTETPPLAQALNPIATPKVHVVVQLPIATPYRPANEVWPTATPKQADCEQAPIAVEKLPWEQPPALPPNAVLPPQHKTSVLPKTIPSVVGVAGHTLPPAAEIVIEPDPLVIVTPQPAVSVALVSVLPVVLPISSCPLVNEVWPVPPLATGSVPETSVARAT